MFWGGVKIYRPTPGTSAKQQIPMNRHLAGYGKGPRGLLSALKNSGVAVFGVPPGLLAEEPPSFSPVHASRYMI